jgi:EAL domain-containing protein (putative c-di-GMP-specific phosphodiesterase class I)
MDAIILNIDRFHTINTLNGRDFGDEVLRALGSEIAGFLAETEGIGGHIEGDHFDIYCAHFEDYQALLDRFQNRLKALFPNTEICLRMGVMPWQDGITPREMFDRAWLACSMVRRDYKTHLMVYDEATRQRDEFNQLLLNSFAHALEARELEVYFQPKYDIRFDPPKLSSAEALVRWNHPTLGMIAPDAFINLFERSGQIMILDKFVWEEAARQVADWRDRYGMTVPVSVNLSRVDVFNPDLASILDGIIEKYGLNCRDLILEVTETAYTENADHLIRIIGQLREKGYLIEMDDFGSGYSSLNMISSLPIDALKLDMLFIRTAFSEKGNTRMIEITLDISHSLSVPMIAEGVETEDQMLALRKLGCDIVQGYYFAKPMPAEEFSAFLTR